MQSLLWPEIQGLFTSNFGVAAHPAGGDPRVPADRPGVPGATAGKCAVSPLVQNIALWPGQERDCNSCKIKVHI